MQTVKLHTFFSNINWVLKYSSFSFSFCNLFFFQISECLSFDLWVEYDPDVFLSSDPLNLSLSLSLSFSVCCCVVVDSLSVTVCLIFFQTLCLIFTCLSQWFNLSKSISSTQTRFKGRFRHDLLTLSSALPVSQSFLSKQTNNSLIFHLQHNAQIKIWWIWCISYENMKLWWNICYERTLLKVKSL